MLWLVCLSYNILNFCVVVDIFLCVNFCLIYNLFHGFFSFLIRMDSFCSALFMNSLSSSDGAYERSKTSF